MACACLKKPIVKSGLMTLSSAAVSTMLVGSMALGLWLTGPHDANKFEWSWAIIFGTTVLLGCYLPMWAPYKVEDWIDEHC